MNTRDTLPPEAPTEADPLHSIPPRKPDWVDEITRDAARVAARVAIETMAQTLLPTLEKMEGSIRRLADKHEEDLEAIRESVRNLAIHLAEVSERVEKLERRSA